MIAMAAENQDGSHPVPIEPALLDWAEYWYPISWKGVLLWRMRDNRISSFAMAHN
jgi:hypothetical protein